ncbi:MAG: DUF1028 domain-containing protein [Chloroflexi bacterium]|nr:DUF1028 domain-containing protein [Chloroflexota bacterium]
MRFHHSELFSTYSIVARDPDTGQFGVAVQTHQMCVGSVVPWLLPGRGAFATQSLANIRFGPMTLAMLQEGISAPHIIQALVASDADAHRRQIAVVDASGQAAAWTGDGCIAQASHHVGQGYSVQANMMTRGTVVDAMARAYESATGDLAQRMLAALEAAQREGGDIRGMQSAALKVVPGDASKPIWAADYDLRVDEHENPVAELARLVRLGRAQVLDGEGHRLLEDARLDEALVKWAEARQIAPELEELPFWQAMALAEKPEHTAAAIEILRPALAQDPSREHWLDLIGRLADCGLLERAGAAGELIAALE